MIFNLNRREFLFKVVPGILLTYSQIAQAQEKDRTFPVPTEGKRIELKDANFSIFPEKLNFKPGKKTLVVSTFWQTGAVYNPDGTRYLIKGDKDKPLFLQLGTGKPDTPTPLGLYEILTNNNENYRSHEFMVDNKKNLGAPMPYAMHLGEIFINDKGELQTMPTKGIAVHGRHTVNENSTVSFMSHGCIGVETKVAKYLQSVLNYRKVGKNKSEPGDYVLVVSDKVPENMMDKKEADIKEVIFEVTKEKEAQPAVEKRPEKIYTKEWDWKDYR